MSNFDDDFEDLAMLMKSKTKTQRKKPRVQAKDKNRERIVEGVTVSERLCNLCELWLPLSSFHRRHTGKAGAVNKPQFTHQARCKECSN